MTDVRDVLRRAAIEQGRRLCPVPEWSLLPPAFGLVAMCTTRLCLPPSVRWLALPVVVAAVVALAGCDSGGDARAASTDAGDSIVRDAGEEVSLALAGGAPASDASFAIGGVLKDGRAIPASKNMTLDAKTGKFSWTPRISQAGAYEISFLVGRRRTAPRRVTRRITIRRGPITTYRGEVAGRLRAWHRDGTAAGNTGDFYDNRDGGHSLLDLTLFPQLDRVEYPEEMRGKRLDWGLQVHFLFPHVTLGNSSTSSGNAHLGSNARRGLASVRRARTLYQQYRRSHLYVYPEHRDHDPGRNGQGGYGDLFPANTPYVIISQGSSGSDRSFVEAVAFTLAAFRPQVKKRLIETGLLMPTVQMILRRSNRNVRGDRDYLTGKAHPTVFEGNDLDTLRMVEMAHAVRLQTIPPMVQLSVQEEDSAVEGRDYIEPGRTETLFDTPSAIARVWRSTRISRRMVVSAVASRDVNNRPLKYHWVLLRGDPSRVRIQPRNGDGSVAELTIRYHRRRPIRPGSAMESNRVDIGVFVHNGAHYSAPGFICFYSFDNELRSYDPAGRIVEIDYAGGQTTIGYAQRPVRARDPEYGVTDWPGLLAVAAERGGGVRGELLRRQLTPQAMKLLRRAASDLRAAVAREAEPQEAHEKARTEHRQAGAAVTKAQQALAAARQAHKKSPSAAAAEALTKAEADLKTRRAERAEEGARVRRARRRVANARRKAHGILTKKHTRLAGSQSIQQRVEDMLNRIKDDPRLYVDNARAIESALSDPAAKQAFARARAALVSDGILSVDTAGRYSLRRGSAAGRGSARGMTESQRIQLERFHLLILNRVLYPGLVNGRFRRNHVSAFLSTPRNWRDVYRYDSAGRLLGWARHTPSGRQEFTRDGAIVVRKDKLGRPVLARTVFYEVKRDGRGIPTSLTMHHGAGVLRYGYASETDRFGRVRKETGPSTRP